MTDEEKKFKDEQIVRMASFSVGGKDSLGNVISRIFAKGDEYIIYEIKTKEISDSIKIHIDPIKEDEKEIEEYFCNVRQKYTEIKGLLYKAVDDTSIKARISHILSHALSGKHGDANNQFDTLIDTINTEYSNQFNHRFRYLLTTMLFMVVCVTLSVWIYHQHKYIEFPQIRNMIFICTSASIGGFLSISRRLRETVFEKGVKWYMYILYGIERMVIASTAGGIIYFAINSNLIFGIVKDLEKPIFGYLIFAVAAGFSETLIPNLLIKLEKKDK